MTATMSRCNVPEVTVASRPAAVSPHELDAPHEPSEPPVPVPVDATVLAPVRTPRAEPPIAKAPAAPTLSAQVEALRSTRAAVGKGGDALDLAVAEFRRRFEGSPLRPEVEALAVEHACRRGHPEALARLRAFTETNPNPGLQARLQRHCAKTQ